MYHTHLSAWLKCIPLTIFAFALIGCVGGSSSLESIPSSGNTSQPDQISVVEAVAQVEEFPEPGDSQLFAQMKDKLIAALEALGTDKIVSTPPRGSGNNVTDLTIENEIAQLNWTYVNVGDYDQNSEVNVADLTPIALNYTRTPAHSNWVSAQVVDGDNNLEVNLADITTIALQYSNSLTGYNIYTSTDLSDAPVLPSDQNGVGALVAEAMDFDQADEQPGFKTFSKVLTAPVDLNWYWVRPTDGFELGAASNAVQFEAPEELNIPPIADLSASPTSGELPLIVDFDATLSTDPDDDGTIELFEWDWDGAIGGLTWESTGTTGTAQHTYEIAGTYDATVRVTDDKGATDTDSIFIVVEEPVIGGLTISGFLMDVSGLPAKAISGIEVHLTSNPPGTYDEVIVSGVEGEFEFTNIPADIGYLMWGDDSAWLWTDPRPIPNTGVLTESITNLWFGTNGPVLP